MEVVYWSPLLLDETKGQLSEVTGMVLVGMVATAAAVTPGAGGEVSAAMFTHKLLYLLERPACKALIAH